MNPNQTVAETIFVAFDFETTGLHSSSDKIVEIGAVKFQGTKILGEFEELVDPKRDIPEDAARVSGITTSMVKGKKTIEELLPSFMDFLGDHIIMAHNASFDLGFLRAALIPTGGKVENTVIDTQVLATKAFPGQKSYSLQNLISFLNIPKNAAHRALDDSIQCMKLFNASADSLSFMGDITLGEVLT
jgi:DNA polymerase-3 subunit epsilon